MATSILLFLSLLTAQLPALAWNQDFGGSRTSSAPIPIDLCVHLFYDRAEPADEASEEEEFEPQEPAPGLLDLGDDVGLLITDSTGPTHLPNPRHRQTFPRSPPQSGPAA